MHSFAPVSELLLLGIQVVVLAIPVYHLLKFLRRTRGSRATIGMAGVVGAFTVADYAARWLRLEELGWLLDKAALYIPFAMIIAFQPELRRLLAEIGGRRNADDRTERESRRDIAGELAKAVASLAGKRCGALLAFERGDRLDAHVQGGCALDAPVVAELVDTIFYPGTSLHDGGVILRDGTIAWAGCVFPLGAVDEDRRAFGTRHRAAIGLTEKTDAVVLVVSEESGMVSIAWRGELVRGLGPESVEEVLRACVPPPPEDGAEPPATVPFEGVFARLKEES